MPQVLLQTWPYGVMGLAVIAASVTDLHNGKIYNWITYPAIAAGLIGHTLFGGFDGTQQSGGLVWSLLGVAAASPLLLAWLAGGIGGGDAKLMLGVGALGGPGFALSVMFYGFAIAAVMAIFVIVHRRVFKATMGRIWRFISLALVRGKPADPSTEESRKIPFGVALCLGSAAALVEYAISGKVLLEW